MTDEDGNVLLRLQNGHIQTKNFNSDSYPLENKKVLFIGDSITNNAQYINAFVSLSKCIDYNRGVAGTTIAENDYVGNSFVERLDKTANNGRYVNDRTEGFPSDVNVDYVIVFGGVNDWGRANHTLVQWGSVEYADKTTYCGAIRYLFEGLKSKYPSKKIYVILPPHVFGFMSEGFDWSEVLKTNGKITINSNVLNKTLEDYRNALRDIAYLLGIEVIDLGRLYSPIIPTDKTQYTLDGLHPNDKGGELIGKYLYNILKNN